MSDLPAAEIVTNTIIAPDDSGAGIVVRIPPTFMVDDKGFGYYLKANDVDHTMELVPCTPEEDMTFGQQGRVREFFFTSQRARERAEGIWYALTGCKTLGKLNNWQKWERFR